MLVQRTAADAADLLLEQAMVAGAVLTGSPGPSDSTCAGPAPPRTLAEIARLPAILPSRARLSVGRCRFFSWGEHWYLPRVGRGN